MILFLLKYAKPLALAALLAMTYGIGYLSAYRSATAKFEAFKQSSLLKQSQLENDLNKLGNEYENSLATKGRIITKRKEAAKEVIRNHADIDSCRTDSDIIRMLNDTANPDNRGEPANSAVK